MEGDRKVWGVVEEYNKFDFLSTEEYWQGIKAWITVSTSMFIEKKKIQFVPAVAETLSSTDTLNTSVGKYRRYKCKDCGSELKSRFSELTKEKRASLKTGTVR